MNPLKKQYSVLFSVFVGIGLNRAEVGADTRAVRVKDGWVQEYVNGSLRRTF